MKVLYVRHASGQVDSYEGSEHEVANAYNTIHKILCGVTDDPCVEIEVSGAHAAYRVSGVDGVVMINKPEPILKQ